MEKEKKMNEEMGKGEAENKRGQTKAEKIHQGRRNWLVSVCLFVCLRGDALVQRILIVISVLFYSGLSHKCQNLLDLKKVWMHAHTFMHTHVHTLTLWHDSTGL